VPSFAVIHSIHVKKAIMKPLAASRRGGSERWATPLGRHGIMTFIVGVS
jgi:hypothetical protein